MFERSHTLAVSRWRGKCTQQGADTCVPQEGLVAAIVMPQAVVVGVGATLLLRVAHDWGAQVWHWVLVRNGADCAPAVHLQPAGRRCMLEPQV